MRERHIRARTRSTRPIANIIDANSSRISSCLEMVCPVGSSCPTQGTATGPPALTTPTKAGSSSASFLVVLWPAPPKELQGS